MVLTIGVHAHGHAMGLFLAIEPLGQARYQTVKKIRATAMSSTTMPVRAKLIRRRRTTRGTSEPGLRLRLVDSSVWLWNESIITCVGILSVAGGQGKSKLPGCNGCTQAFRPVIVIPWMK